MSNGFAISKPVPLAMRLYSYMGGVALGNGLFLVFGGVRDFMDKVQKSTFIYNAITENAAPAKKMCYEVYII